MEKNIILTLIIFSIISCSDSKSINGLERARLFYIENKDTNFEDFKCFNILQWDQNRENRKEEYHIEFYPNCQSEIKKPLRGRVKFEDGQSVFRSDEMQINDLPPHLLEKFYDLQVSNLFYKNPKRLELTLYPEVRLIWDCKQKKEGYSSFDICWHYKILK